MKRRIRLWTIHYLYRTEIPHYYDTSRWSARGTVTCVVFV